MVWQSARSLRDAIVRHAYWLLWAAVALVYAWRVLAHELGRDIFEHAASIRELATSVWDPLHPIFAVDAPHSLFSPYALGLGLIQRALEVDPLGLLAVAGFVNLVVLAIGLRLFVRQFTSSPHAAALTLLFSLVLWGVLPPAWSGMLHLQSLSFGLPYPSALVLGLVLIALVELRRYLRTGGWLRPIAIAAVTTFAILSHPYTAALLALASLAFLIEAIGDVPIRRIATVTAAGLAGAALAIPWPLFPVIDLLVFRGDVFAADHVAMYTSIVPWTFPAWPGVIALAVRWRRTRRDPLAVTFGLLLTVYLIGWVVGSYNLGRLLPPMVLVLHVALGVTLASWLEARRRPPRAHAATWAVRAGAAALALLALASVGRIVLATHDSYAEIAWVARAIPQYDVVMADLETSGRVPVWGGKVVGWGGSLPFVDDRDAREEDARRFFAPGTNQADRRAILRRWDARWIMFDRGRAELDAASIEAIVELGALVEGEPGGGTVVLLRADGT